MDRPIATVETLALFLKETRAGATALMAVFATLMALGGAAFLTDHVWLVDQRDTLKNAANAASIAATHAMRDELAANPGINTAALKAAVKPVARSHILMNLLHLPEKRYERAKETLVVGLDLNRNAFTVSVDASADLGGFLLSAALGYIDPGTIEATNVRAGVEASLAPLSVVLAIDVSQSMLLGLDGRSAFGENQRMEIVKKAASDLLDIATPDPNIPVSVGIVPWSAKVCPSDYCTSYDHSDTPPATDRTVVEAGLGILSGRGTRTASLLGIERGHELLMAIDGVDTRALVLLTDGEDNFCGYRDKRESILFPRPCPNKGAALRQAACDSAKADGIRIFAVAAMPHSLVGGSYEQGLRSCSSEGDHDGRYVFVNNATPEDLRAAFADIANQLKSMRRIY